MRSTVLALLLIANSAMAAEITSIQAGAINTIPRGVEDSASMLPYKENAYCKEQPIASSCMHIGFSLTYKDGKKRPSLHCLLSLKDKKGTYPLFNGDLELPQDKGTLVVTGSIKKDSGDTGVIEMILSCSNQQHGEILRSILVDFGS